MNPLEPFKRRWYPCSCSSSDHFVRLTWNNEKDPDEPLGWLELHGSYGTPMEDDTSLLGWWRRLKAALAILRYRHYSTVEVILEPSVARQLAAELLHGAEVTEKDRNPPQPRPAATTWLVSSGGTFPNQC